MQSDVAFATALHILELFDLRDEEKREAFGLTHEGVKAGTLANDKETKDLLRRLKPLGN